MREVDINGGDFGTGDFVTQINEFPLVVKIAANILHQARKVIPEAIDKRLSYCIRLNLDYSDLIHELIKREERLLPGDVIFYEVDRNKIFDLRGVSGGVTTHKLCYLITKW